jgi:hypothetical protein
VSKVPEPIGPVRFRVTTRSVTNTRGGGGSLLYQLDPWEIYTGLCGGLEHLKIETRLRDERFESVMGECVI